MLEKLWKGKEVSSEMPNGNLVKSGTPLAEKTLPFNKHPKILLIDLKDDSEKTLKSAGFNAESGTFGTPYKIKISSNYVPVDTNAKLPNYEEQEIIVFDLLPQPTSEITRSTESVLGEKSFWGKCSQGFIDPRPITTHIVRDKFDRILDQNGIFIIFADNSSLTEIVWAFDSRSYGFNVVETGFDIWSFIKPLDAINFQADSSSGTEIIVERPDTLLGKLISRYANKSKFTCILRPKQVLEYRTNKVIQSFNRDGDAWVVTAVNKYKDPIAGVITPDENHKGWIFIFPQIADKANFLLELLRDVLPTIVPERFPYSENKDWTEREEYQPLSVQELNKEIEKIKEESNRKIEALNEKIKEEKAQVEYQNKLLTDDGDSLVEAVEFAFKVLGFKNVVNVDEDYKKQGKTNSNDEDLQIRDEGIDLLVEIKGVVGYPKDDDVFQVTKHVPIRMREWKSFDVKALSIINHQKAIPALDRENTLPFRQLVLDSATEQGLSLMTTFDFYRLVRSFIKNDWKHENIKDLFVQSGRVQIIPSHYQFVGVIEHYWEKAEAVGIRVKENSISVGDTIAFELPLEFEEMRVDSLQVEKQIVQTANASELAGIKTNLSKDTLKKGIKVFRKLT